MSSVTEGRTVQIITSTVNVLRLTHMLLLNVNLNLIVFTAGDLTCYVVDNAKSLLRKAPSPLRVLTQVMGRRQTLLLLHRTLLLSKLGYGCEVYSLDNEV